MTRNLIVVAGCNGAGKTTYVSERNDLGEYTRIDPDALYARVRSWRAVAREISVAFVESESIVLETTFSGRGAIERIRRAANEGFSVTLVFIGTASPAVNISRIAKRVAEGGHDVPRNDVLRRWPRALQNLLRHHALADTLLLFDNSSTRLPFRSVAKRERDGSMLIWRAPRWARNVLRAIGEGVVEC